MKNKIESYLKKKIKKGHLKLQSKFLSQKKSKLEKLEKKLHLNLIHKLQIKHLQLQLMIPNQIKDSLNYQQIKQ